MSTGLLVSLIMATAVGVNLLLAGPAICEPVKREPLDDMWEQYMFKGQSQAVGIVIEGDQVKIVEYEGVRRTHPPTGIPEAATWEPHGISVSQTRGNLFSNGWWLHGGLLGRATDGPSTIDLYGNVVDRIPPHFWRPWWMEEPYVRGYEFFLLCRQDNIPPVIVHKWIVQPDEVINKEDPMDVQATLRYASTKRMADVQVKGLSRIFWEQIDLSTCMPSSPLP